MIELDSDIACRTLKRFFFSLFFVLFLLIFAF